MKRLLATLVIAVGLSVGGPAQAASLNYNSDESISLTSPATTFTITAGSVADALMVNATSAAVTLSSITGGTFTLTSASYDLTVASSSGGGTASLSCSLGVASVTISQTTGQANYTITPTASQCTTPSNGGGSGGGGSGGSGSVGVASCYVTPGPIGYSSPCVSGSIEQFFNKASSSASMAVSAPISSSTLLSQIDALKAELATLLTKAGKTPAASSGDFTRNLSFGMTGNDVKELQGFLITQASGPAAAKLKAHGTTKNFGILTFKALKEFQTKAGIVPASGYFGPKTRGYATGEE